MSDLGSANWAETDASNNATPPNGWPEGMNPSDVNNAARANMGAIKRLYDRQNLVLTTGGTSTAYTLTNAVAQAAYYAGERASFIVNATCGAAPTLNIDGLGAFNIRKFSGGSFVTLSAGDIVANQPLEVYYNSGATTFDIITQVPQTVWQTLGVALPSSASTVDFTGIPTTINTLDIRGNLTTSVDGATVALQVYGTGAVLDTSANYSCWSLGLTTLGGGTVAFSVASSITSCPLGGVGNGLFGINFVLMANNIQASHYTLFNGTSNYLAAGGSTGTAFTLNFQHAVAANITGVRILVSSGTISGRVTLFGSTN